MMKSILNQNEDMRRRLARLDAASSSIASSEHFDDDDNDDDSSTIRGSRIRIDQERTVEEVSLPADRSKSGMLSTIFPLSENSKLYSRPQGFIEGLNPMKRMYRLRVLQPEHTRGVFSQGIAWPKYPLFR